LQNG